MILTAAATEVSDIRRVLEELRVHVSSQRSEDLADHLAAVIWELAFNHVVHAGVPGKLAIELLLDRAPSTIVIEYPGPWFDSVGQATRSNARGLDTAAWRLKCCSWEWFNEGTAGTNRVTFRERES